MPKGISTVISAILLVLLTLTSVLIAYTFISGVQTKTQQEAGETGERISQETGSKIDINSLTCRATIKKSTVGYWNLNEKYGTSFSDISGNGNSGELKGDTILNGNISDAKWVKGRYGNALEFKGGAQVKVGDKEDINIKEGLTIMGWFKPSSDDNNFQAIVAKDDFSSDYAIGFNPGSNTIKAYLPALEDSDFDGSVEYKGEFEEEWYHFTFIWNPVRQIADIYINGDIKERAWGTNGTLSTGDDLFIGNNVKGDSFEGRIEEVAVFNRSITEKEVGTYMKNHTLNRAGLEAFWAFNHGFGEKAYDTHHIAKAKYKRGVKISPESSIVVQDSSELSPTKEITIEAVIRPHKEINGSDPRDKGVVCTGTLATSYCLYYPGSKSRLKFKLPDVGVLFSDESNWKRKWYHVVATYDGREMKIYVNDKLDSSKKVSGEFQKNLGKLTLGNTKPEVKNAFPGVLDEIRIADKALNPSSFLDKSVIINVGNTGEEIPEGDWVVYLRNSEGNKLATMVSHKNKIGENGLVKFQLPSQLWDLKEGREYRIEVESPLSSKDSATCKGQ